jgi:hypothetical protein
VRAIVSLITTTGSLDLRSLSVNGRPARNRIPAASKYPSLTTPNERLRHVTSGINLSLAGNAPGPVIPQRQDIGNTGRHNARDRSHTLQHTVNENVLLRETRDSKTRVDPQCRRPFRLKSKIHVEDAQKTPNEQARAD